MAPHDWLWDNPPLYQSTSWTCSATSIAWSLTAMGQPATEADVVNEMGPARINPDVGLTDASGAGIVSYLAEIGIPAQNNSFASWDDVVAAAGYQPMVIGGRAWNHWVAVRMGAIAWVYYWPNGLYLMNPAPGWMGVEHWLTPEAFAQLGDFSAVWFPG